MDTNDKQTLSLPGYGVGDLFAQTVLDVKNSVPAGFTGAIDIQVEFAALGIAEKGYKFVFRNTTTQQSSLSLKLATRIYTDAPVVPNHVLVAYMQKSLIADHVYQGSVDGLVSATMQTAIDAAINARNADADLVKLRNGTDGQKYLGYLQYAMNKQLVQKIDVDGEDGPQTQRAIFSLFGTYTKTVTEATKTT